MSEQKKKASKRTITSEEIQQSPFLIVNDLKKSFTRNGIKNQVLKGVSFTLNKGEVLSIIGSSGGGKTTLLRAMTFLTPPDEGQIIVNGETIYDGSYNPKDTSNSIRQKRLHFGLVFQQFNLFPHYNIITNITLAPMLLAKEELKLEYKKIDAEIPKGKTNKIAKEELKQAKNVYEFEKFKAKNLYNIPDLKYDKKEALDDAKYKYTLALATLSGDKNKLAKIKAKYNIITSINSNALALLKRVGLEDKKTSYPGELSGGQQQRVAIARALALNPEILCFDEPTSALDPELTGEVLKVIKSLKSKDTTMVIVTHEMQFAKDVSDKVIFIANGLIEEMGTPDEIFVNPQKEKTKSFLAKFLS